MKQLQYIGYVYVIMEGMLATVNSFCLGVICLHTLCTASHLNVESSEFGNNYVRHLKWQLSPIMLCPSGRRDAWKYAIVFMHLWNLENNFCKQLLARSDVQNNMMS